VVNDKYCKWCYYDNCFHVADTVDELIENILPYQNWGTPDEMRKFLREQLPTLEYWESKKVRECPPNCVKV
ncbi:MAG: zinc ribbon domain-containing protein, partial [Oscillospiraceae bacterium]|nr:zinc ribbon domain-containing protein [Oscillospiraceae bacterium]